MTFREQLIHQLQCQGANTERAATELADAIVAEVRRGDAARLLAERSSHTSRALFCDGITHAAHLLQEWADGGAPGSVASEAYPNELAAARTVIRLLRSAALRREDLARVQQILTDHATGEAAARDQAAGDPS